MLITGAAYGSSGGQWLSTAPAFLPKKSHIVHFQWNRDITLCFTGYGVWVNYRIVCPWKPQLEIH